MLYHLAHPRRTPFTPDMDCSYEISDRRSVRGEIYRRDKHNTPWMDGEQQLSGRGRRARITGGRSEITEGNNILYSFDNG